MRSGAISASGTNTLVSTAAYDIPDNILFTLGTDSDIALVLNTAGVAADTALTGVIEGTARRMATGANSLLVSNITNDGDIQFLVSDGGHSWGMLTFNGDDHSAHFGQSDWGVDVKFWGATANYYLLWDESGDDLVLSGANATFSIDATLDSSSTTTGSFHTDGGVGIAKKLFVGTNLDVDGTTQLDDTLTIGSDGTGHDATFYGDTASAYTKWEAANNRLFFAGAGTLRMGTMNSADLVRSSSAPRSMEIFSKIGTDEDITTTLRGLWSRFRIDADTQIGSNAGWGEGIDGIEANVKLYGGATGTGTQIYCWQIAGVWAMLECDDTNYIHFESGSHACGLFGHIELGAGTQVESGGAAAALVAFSNSHASATIETGGTYSGLLIDKESGKLSFTDGIRIEDSVCTTGIDIGTCTTGINFSGTVTDGILFAGTVSDEAIQIGGTYDHGIRFTEDPVAADNTNSFINIGDYGTPIAVAPTSAHMFGEMHNVSLTGVNVAYWYQAKYTKITTSGTTTDTSVAADAIRMQIGSSLGAVYGIQCHTNITATNTCANEIISVSALVDLATGTTTTTDRVCAFQAMINGSGTAGTVTGDTFVAYLVNGGTVITTDAICKIFNQSAATATNGLHIENDGTCTTGIKLEGTYTNDVTFQGDTTLTDDGTDLTLAGANLEVSSHIGLGGATPSAIRGLYYVETYTNPASDVFGLDIQPTRVETSANVGNELYGLRLYPTVGSANNKNWTASPLGLRGVEVIPYSAGGSGTITGVAGVSINPSLGGSSLTFTNLYDIYIDNDTGNSTLTNQYGIYMVALTGGATLNYAIYTQGGLHHFGDHIDLTTDKAIRNCAAINNTAYAAIVEILGDCSIFIPCAEATGSTITDYTSNGHDATTSKDISTWDTPPAYQGSQYVYDCDGVDEEMDVADHADFSTATAFSCGAWVNMTDATDSTIQAVWDENGAGEKREYKLYLDGSDRPSFRLFDETNNVGIGRYDATALTEGTWYYVVGVFTGGTDAANAEVYVNGLPLSDNDIEDEATFADIVDSGAALDIGFEEDASSNPTKFFDGKWWGQFYTKKELSADEVWNLYKIGAGLLNV